MKRVFILISVVCISFAIKAQFLNSPSLQLIEKAIQKGVFCVEKGYQLQDSNLNVFGRENKDEFNIFYSLGIKTSKGYLFSHQAVYPWLFDKDFDEYKDSYTPIPLKSKFKYNSFEVKPLNDVSVLTEDSLTYLISDEGNTLECFDIGDIAPNTQGWLSWIYVNDSSLSFVTRTKKIDSVNNETLEEPQNTLKSPGKLIGGVFVVPVCEIGVIKLQLCGVVVQKEDNWILTFPFYKPKEKVSNLPSNLTPIKTKTEKPKEQLNKNYKKGKSKKNTDKKNKN